MANIINPVMRLSTSQDTVTLTVSYMARFGEHETVKLPTGSPALWFTERIDVIGAKYTLGFSAESLEPQLVDMPRQRTQSFPREYFESGVLPTVIRCRVRIDVAPPVGAEKETNTAVIRSRSLSPFRPLTGLSRAVSSAVGAMVIAAMATALVRMRNSKREP
jgi:hypothetical protein